MPDIPRVPLVYRLLRRLPTRARLMLVYLTSPKLTVGAGAIAWNADGHVLLVHHTYRHPGWGFPSGLIGRREDPGTALERELHEELGVRAHADTLLYAETHFPIRHLTLYYQVSIQGTPCPNGTELDGFEYVALEDLEAMAGVPPRPWLWAARAGRCARAAR
jgi:8-oxo-dGTP pyrophosphatase MutT (NUDIX family)